MMVSRTNNYLKVSNEPMTNLTKEKTDFQIKAQFFLYIFLLYKSNKTLLLKSRDNELL